MTYIMRRVCSLSLPLALLFIAASVYSSYAQSAGAAAERRVAVAAGAALTVQCELGVAQRLRWRLDGRDVPASLRPAGERAQAGRVLASLHAAHALPAHAGLYTCTDDSPRSAAVRVAVLPPGAEGAAGAAGGAVEVVFEVRGNLSLDCSALAADAAPLLWRVNGTELDKLPEPQRKRLALSGKGGAVLAVEGRAAEDDFGNYSCAAAGRELLWHVRGRTRAHLPPNTNVVEGQKLKITCKLYGKPYPAVEWLYSDDPSEERNYTAAVAEALGARATVRDSEQGVAGGELLVEPAARGDEGWYQCRPAAPDAVPDVTRLRVKDMYAALWPFLGICAEVFVLCAIILVYEKRRTKPELDDSDTDNHDQKKS